MRATTRSNSGLITRWAIDWDSSTSASELSMPWSATVDILAEKRSTLFLRPATAQ